MPFFPFIYDKKQKKKKEPLPLYVEEVPYNESCEPQENQEDQEDPRVIIDIM